METLIHVLVIAVVILNVYDYISTSLVLSKGRGKEANPIIAKAIEYLGKQWWIVKLSQVPPLYAVWTSDNLILALVTVVVLTLVYAYVVYHNYMILWWKA